MRGKKKMTEKTYEKTNGIYVGKELAGQGGEPGKEWKRYKVKFKPTMESDKSFSFTCFGNLKGENTKQVSELEDGTKYGINYSQEIRQTPNGEDYPSKTVMGFYEPYTDLNNQAPQNNGQASAPVAPFATFATQYFEACKNGNKAPNKIHMVGSYLLSTEQERLKPILEACEKAISEAEVESQAPQAPPQVII